MPVSGSNIVIFDFVTNTPADSEKKGFEIIYNTTKGSDQLLNQSRMSFGTSFDFDPDVNSDRFRDFNVIVNISIVVLSICYMGKAS